jgi:flagellum-specific ATP synthase
VGERGRELLEFVEKDLGPEGLARSVVVCATSDKSPLLRMRSAYVATTIAEYFRDQGLDVVLMMDSVTRFAMAQREISLSIGEPPSSKGYTPSVFATLPKLLERAGNSPDGSITGIYSVLVEGDDLEDPIADTVRATIDGHIVLSRKLAEKNHYPAIDVSASVSRVMNDVIDGDHYKFASEIKELITVYRDAEDLISVGAYIKGSNPKIDKAIEVHDLIEKFLRQRVDEEVDLDTLKGMMERILIKTEDFE